MQYLETPRGRVAHVRHAGRGPGVVFLPGYRSDMEGTKALFLEDRCRAEGRAFLRFDYTGHGASDRRIEQTTPEDWRDDALAVLSLTEGPQVLVGSSLGGWMALAVARDVPDRVHGVVGVAAAPDFTEEMRLSALSPEARVRLQHEGRVLLSEDQFDGPDYLTMAQVEGGRRVAILPATLRVPGRVRLLQGTADEAVSRETALRLLDHVAADDVRLTLMQGADHRFSQPDCLEAIWRAVREVLGDP